MKRYTIKIKFIATILFLSMFIGQNTIYSTDISDHNYNPMALSIRVGVPDIDKVARAVFCLCFDEISESRGEDIEFLEKIIRHKLDEYNRKQNGAIKPIIDGIDFKGVSFDKNNKCLTIPYKEEEIVISQGDSSSKTIKISPKIKVSEETNKNEFLSFSDFKRYFKLIPEFEGYDEVKMSPGGRWFIAKKYSVVSRIFEIKDHYEKPIMIFEWKPSANNEQFLNNDKYILADAADGVKLVDLERGDCIFTMNSRFELFKPSPCNNYLLYDDYSGYEDIVFDLTQADRSKINLDYLTGGGPAKYQFIREGNKLLKLDHKNSLLKAFDLKHEREILSVPYDGIEGITTSKGKFLIVQDNQYDQKSGKKLYNLEASENSKIDMSYLIGTNIKSFIFSDDGKNIVTFYNAGVPKVFDIEYEKEVLQLAPVSPACVFFKCDKYLIIQKMSYWPSYLIYDLKEADPSKRDLSYLFGDSINNFVISRDGKKGVIFSRGTNPRVFDIENKRVIMDLDNDTGECSFVNDSQILTVDSSCGKYIGIYDLTNDKIRCENLLELFGKETRWFKFSYDNNRLMCFYGSSVIRIFDLKLKKLICEGDSFGYNRDAINFLSGSNEYLVIGSQEAPDDIRYIDKELINETTFKDIIGIIAGRCVYVGKSYKSRVMFYEDSSHFVYDYNFLKDRAIYSLLRKKESISGYVIKKILRFIAAGVINNENDYKEYMNFFFQENPEKDASRERFHRTIFSEKNLMTIQKNWSTLSTTIVQQANIEALGLFFNVVPEYVTAFNLSYLFDKSLHKFGFVRKAAISLLDKYKNEGRVIFNDSNLQKVCAKILSNSIDKDDVAAIISCFFPEELTVFKDLLSGHAESLIKDDLINLLGRLYNENKELKADKVRDYLEVINHIEKHIRIRQPQATDFDLVNEDDIVAITKFLFSHTYDPDRLKAIFDMYFNSEDATTNKQIDKFSLKFSKKNKAAFYDEETVPEEFRKTHRQQQRKLDYNFFIPFMLNFVNSEDTTTTYEAEIFFKLFTSKKLHQSRKEKPIVRKELDLLDATFSGETKTFVKNILKIIGEIFDIQNCPSNQLDSTGKKDMLMSSEIAWEFIHYLRLAQDLSAIKEDIKQDPAEKSNALEWKIRVIKAMELLITDNKEAIKQNLISLENARDNFKYFYKYEKVKVLYDLFNGHIYESNDERKRNMSDLIKYSMALPMNQDGQSAIDSFIELVRSNLNYPEVVGAIHQMLIQKIRGNFEKWRYESPDYIKMFTKHNEILKTKGISEKEIASQGEKIRKAWENNTYCKDPNDGDAHYYGITDDFATLLNLGTPSYFGSCQATYKPSYNRGLSGTMANGWNKAVVAFDKNGKFLARRIIRLRLTKEGEFVLIKEPTYGDSNNDPTFDSIVAKLAYDMGIRYQPDTAETISHIEFFLWKGNSEWEYSDDYGKQFPEDVGLVRISGDDELVATLDIPLKYSTQTNMPYQEAKESEYIQIADKIDTESAQDAKMIMDTSLPRKDFITIGTQLYFRGVPVYDLTIEEKDKKDLVELSNIDKEKLEKYGALYKDPSSNKLYRIKPEDLLIQKVITDSPGGLKAELNLISGESTKSMDVIMELEIIAAIHSLSHNLIPIISGEKETLYHIISEDLIPHNMLNDVKILTERMNKIKELKEKILILPKDKIEGKIAELSNDNKNDICAAITLDDKKIIPKLPYNAVGMTFGADKDTEFVDVEAIIDVLRALYNKDGLRLIELYKRISSEDLDAARAGEIMKIIDNPASVVKILSFNLRPIKNLTDTSFRELKRSLLECLASA